MYLPFLPDPRHTNILENRMEIEIEKRNKIIMYPTKIYTVSLAVEV